MVTSLSLPDDAIWLNQVLLNSSPRKAKMFTDNKMQTSAMVLTLGLLGFAFGPAAAAIRIEGQVQAAGAPIARSTVTLWAASAGEPNQVAQTRSRADGRFELRAKETPGEDIILYLVAKG